jgi:GH15 family glucan-1,4-alpha-glucosidase
VLQLVTFARLVRTYLQAASKHPEDKATHSRFGIRTPWAVRCVDVTRARQDARKTSGPFDQPGRWRRRKETNRKALSNLSFLSIRFTRTLSVPAVSCERLLTLQNEVGLLSEEYDLGKRRLVGDFPQAFSHVALVNTALRLGHFAEPVLAFRGLEKTA